MIEPLHIKTFNNSPNGNFMNIRSRSRIKLLGKLILRILNKETILIGSPEDVKGYYTTRILSETADLRTGKLCTLVDEMNELAQAADGDKG